MSEQNKDKLSLTEKMLLVYGKVKSIHKTGKINMDKDKGYKVVTHDEVTRVLHDAFADVGIVCLPSQRSCVISEYKIISVWNDKENVKTGYKAEVTVDYTFINASDPKDTLTSVATAFAMDPSDKAIGKAYSMAVKMILLKTFMLESTDEEEARTAEEGTSYNETKAIPKAPFKVPVTKQQEEPVIMKDPGQYKMTFMNNYKDKTVAELYDANELERIVFYLKKQPKLTGDAPNFLANALAYVKSIEDVPY